MRISLNWTHSSNEKKSQAIEDSSENILNSSKCKPILIEAEDGKELVG